MRFSKLCLFRRKKKGVVSIYITETVKKWIISANGNKICILTKQPSSIHYKKKRFHLIIVVPGGIGSGIPYLDKELFKSLPSNGTIVIAFNPQGRGKDMEMDFKSEGEENFNGFIHQEDLRRVIQDAQGRTNVDLNCIGVISFSYGISMAAGCLGRNKDLPIKFLIDIEGPSDSYVIMGDPWLLDNNDQNDITDELYILFDHMSTEMDSSASNRKWWSEREALRFISSIKATYMRIQAFWDHMQPPNQEYPLEFDKPSKWYQNKHAIDMLNAATDGKTPWTRMNGKDLENKVNTLYSRENQPVYHSGGFDFSSPEFSETILRAIEEMISLKL